MKERIGLAAEFAGLVAGVRAYAAGRAHEAEEHWRELERSSDRLVQIFARALLANVEPARAVPENLYAPSADERRQIDLFELLGQLPFFARARSRVLEVHAAHVPEGATLLDLGPGNGVLTEAIVEACEGRIARVVAIDLDPLNVAATWQRLQRFGDGLAFEGVAAPMEELKPNRLREVLGDGPVCVNAAFALHHLSLEAKGRALDLVAALDPAVFALAEPHTDHWSADLLTRLVNAFAHFHAVRMAMRASDVDPAGHAPLLEFFGREIRDIMRDHAARFERHESWLFWYQALLARGLGPLGGVALTPHADCVELLPGVSNITAENTHLLSVFAFAAAR